MRQLLFPIFFLVLVLSSCTNNEENGNLIPEQSSTIDENEVVIQLMGDMNETAKQYLAETPTTRGRGWNFFLRLIFADGHGYGVGRQGGLSRTLSLGMAILNSMLLDCMSDAAIEPDPNNSTIIYSDPTLPELIGSIHNQVIVEKTGSNSIKDINIDIRTVMDINNNATNKLEACLIDSFIPNDIRFFSQAPVVTEEEAYEELYMAQTIAAQSSIEEMIEVTKTLTGIQDTSDFYFLKQYVTNINDINNKELIREFTININNKIDKSSLSQERADDLKTMIAISENSFSLWKMTE